MTSLLTDVNCLYLIENIIVQIIIVTIHETGYTAYIVLKSGINLNIVKIQTTLIKQDPNNAATIAPNELPIPLKAISKTDIIALKNCREIIHI